MLELLRLRYRLLICVGSVVVLMIPAWFLYPWFIELLNQPYCSALVGQNPDANCDFLVTNILVVLGVVSVYLRVGSAGAGGQREVSLL